MGAAAYGSVARGNRVRKQLGRNRPVQGMLVSSAGPCLDPSNRQLAYRSTAMHAPTLSIQRTTLIRRALNVAGVPRQPRQGIFLCRDVEVNVLIAEELSVVRASHRGQPTQDGDVTRLRIAVQMPTLDDVVAALAADEPRVISQASKAVAFR